MKIKVEFRQKEITIEIEQDEITVADLIYHLRERIQERHDFFLTKDNLIRPGIIVLINDSDWEIFDKENTVLENGNTVSFISTLHGG